MMDLFFKYQKINNLIISGGVDFGWKARAERKNRILIEMGYFTRDENTW